MLVQKGIMEKKKVGNYEMTAKGATVLTDLNLLSNYYVLGIARPWLTVNMARSKTIGPIPFWATQSKIINFNHYITLTELLLYARS